jgi:rubrerythrin
VIPVRNTKLEILEHLKEILKMEEKAEGAYTELARSVESAQLKSFFMYLAEEEKHHAKIVRDMILLLEGSSSEPWHEPPPS